MKKKLMMVAVLLGALSLGACVDDNESASVTAIRDAQAQKQAALADLYSAQAEAEGILANAQAELYRAQAAYEQARANAEQASADSINFALQKAQDEYERNLEAIELEAQTRLLQAQIDAQAKAEQLAGMLDDHLINLYTDYTLETNELLSLQSQLSTAETNLARYNAELITATDYNETLRAQYSAYIAQAEAQIEAYEAYAGIDQSELANQMTSLQMQASAAYQTYLQQRTLTLDARTNYNEVIAPFNTPDAENTSLVILQAADTLQTLGLSLAYENVEFADEVENENGTMSTTFAVRRYSLPGQYEITRVRQDLTNRISTLEGALGVRATSTTPAEGFYLDLFNAEGQLEAAETAENQTDIDYWTLEIARINDQIDEYEDVLIPEARQNLTYFEEALADFTTANLTAYDNAIEALAENETVVAYITAVTNEYSALDAYNGVNDELIVVNNLYNNSVDAEAQIAQLNTNIADWNASIARLNTATEEGLVAETELLIEQLQNQIAAQEAIVAIVKAQLDEALAADDSEGNPDTPAEEETPAA